MNRKIKTTMILIIAGMILISCAAPKPLLEREREVPGDHSIAGSYLVTEKYNILAGALTGKNGESKYSIVISNGKNEGSLIIVNFANSFKVTAAVKGDSIDIPRQKFPYQNEFVSIEGKGKIFADSIYYQYFSGGPAGRIECKCSAVKIK